MDSSCVIFFRLQALYAFLSAHSNLSPFISAFFLLVRVLSFFFPLLFSFNAPIHLQNLLEVVFLIIFISVSFNGVLDFFFQFIFSRFLLARDPLLIFRMSPYMI